MLLSHFQIIRPPFESSQESSFDWFLEAHTKSESTKGGSEELLASFREKLKQKLWHVGCKPDRIEKRGHVLDDFLHLDWEKMKIYSLHESPKGKDLSFRSEVYETEVDKVFLDYYPESSLSPDDLIHVSCTGYISPSGAQKIVSLRGWGNHTTVTHAYHMGCYGSIPALRMAIGFLRSEERKKQVDIVHTELCSLHINPSHHSSDQLVTQSLFADGFVKYSAVKETKEPHFKIVALQEEIIPDSTHCMTWNVVDWGNQLYLSKEVPILIGRHLPGYLKRLSERSKIGDLLQNGIFALHPGGPKILLQIQELFHLSDFQMQFSFEILRKYGNMSSATLPHIWEAILKEETIAHQTPIVSLAFGPGLSISGNVMEKICGS